MYFSIVKNIAKTQQTLYRKDEFQEVYQESFSASYLKNTIANICTYIADEMKLNRTLYNDRVKFSFQRDV